MHLISCCCLPQQCTGPQYSILLGMCPTILDYIHIYMQIYTCTSNWLLVALLSVGIWVLLHFNFPELLLAMHHQEVLPCAKRLLQSMLLLTGKAVSIGLRQLFN